MDVVNHASLRESTELFRLVVAGQTALTAGLSLAFDDVQMALLTVDRSPDHVLVIEADRPDHDVPFRSTVAAGAARDRSELLSVLGLLEMTEKARPPVDLEMAIDDHLGMTAGAA